MLNKKRFIREVESTDIDRIIQIEREAHVNPWSRAFLNKQLETSANGLLIEHDALTVGYLVYHRILDEAEILNLVTAPEVQNQGYASSLMSEFLEILKTAKVNRVYLEVASDNLAAIALYKKHLFERIGERKNYYKREQGRCDAMLMSRTI